MMRLLSQSVQPSVEASYSVFRFRFEFVLVTQFQSSEACRIEHCHAGRECGDWVLHVFRTL